ncbi:unnamed protein product, partial [Ixodes pacificus]
LTFIFSKWFGSRSSGRSLGANLNVRFFWNSTSWRTGSSDTVEHVSPLTATTSDGSVIVWPRTRCPFKFFIRWGTSAKKAICSPGTCGWGVMLTTLLCLPAFTPNCFHIARLLLPMSLVTATT